MPKTARHIVYQTYHYWISRREFFENLLSPDNSLENLLSLDNNYLRVPHVETPNFFKMTPNFLRWQVETIFDDVEFNEICIRKRAQKEKVLGPDEFNSQFIFFYLVQRNENSVTETTPYVLQVETYHKTYQRPMSSRDNIFFWKDDEWWNWFSNVKQ